MGRGSEGYKDPIPHIKMAGEFMEDLRLISHGFKTLRASITSAQCQKKALSEVRMGTMAPWKRLP